MSNKTATAKKSRRWKLFVPLMLCFILIIVLSNETTANNPPEKIGTGENDKPNQVTTDSDFMWPLDKLKRELIWGTPKETFWRAESLYQEAEAKLKKVPIKNGYYQPHYNLIVTMDGYLAAIIAIDSYLLSKGTPLNSLPSSIFSSNDIEKYVTELIKIPDKGKSLAFSFRVIFNNLFTPGYSGQKREVDKMNEGFKKVKFVITTLKEEAMKEKGWEKIPVVDSMKKTERFGGEKSSQEMIVSDDIEVFDILALTKRRLLGITSKETFFRADSIYKQAREGLKNAPIENGLYLPDGAFALGASSDGYLAAILAIDGYLLSKVIPPESMPRWAVFSFEKYEAVLTKIPGKGKVLASSFKIVYNNLIIPNYTQKQEIKIVNEGLDKVKFIINILKEEAKKEKGWR